jgi:hypothetical protein
MLRVLQEDTGDWKKRGGNIEGAPKKDFGAIPYFLVIADYEKAFLYVGLK